MRLFMTELIEMAAIQSVMDSPGFHLFYLSRPGCGVCSAVRSKVEVMMENYPYMDTYYVNLDRVPEAAGQKSVFTIPAILVYADGKELIREARYLSISSLDGQIDRFYSLAFRD